MAPYMFVGLIAFLLIGYPVAFSLCAVAIAFAIYGISSGLLDAGFLNTIPLRLFGIMSNELLLAIPFFTFMGAILERSRLSEDMLEGFRAVVRAGPRRTCLCGHLRRRGTRRHYRHGRSLGDRHGDDRAAGDDALRLQYAARHRSHRRLGHDHPAHSPCSRPHCACRAIGEAGGRYVSRRHRTVGRSSRAVLPVHPGDEHHFAQIHAGASSGSAHAARLGTRQQALARNDPFARAHFRGARDHSDGACDAHRIGGDGGGRLSSACLVQPAA